MHHFLSSFFLLAGAFASPVPEPLPHSPAITRHAVCKADPSRNMPACCAPVHLQAPQAAGILANIPNCKFGVFLYGGPAAVYSAV